MINLYALKITGKVVTIIMLLVSYLYGWRKTILFCTKRDETTFGSFISTIYVAMHIVGLAAFIIWSWF